MRVNLPPARLVALAALLAAPLALAACDTVSDALGVGKMPPDEYAVAPRRPLAMPPDVNLRAPQPGAPSTADISASGIAASAMATTGNGAGTTAAPTTPVTARPVDPAAPPPTASPVTGDTSPNQPEESARKMQTSP